MGHPAKRRPHSGSQAPRMNSREQRLWVYSTIHFQLRLQYQKCPRNRRDFFIQQLVGTEKWCKWCRDRTWKIAIPCDTMQYLLSRDVKIRPAVDSSRSRFAQHTLLHVHDRIVWAMMLIHHLSPDTGRCCLKPVMTIHKLSDLIMCESYRQLAESVQQAHWLVHQFKMHVTYCNVM